jgi:hypothetical protein
MQKQFQKNLEIVLKARKILEKFQKFLEVDWGTNNPNKVFGAHEKYFRAF